MALVQDWTEPVIRVQSLSDNGLTEIPQRYVKPKEERPLQQSKSPKQPLDFPVINLSEAFSVDPEIRNSCLELIDHACRHWGFFKVVNHGVPQQIMHDMIILWRRFFSLPMNTKQIYSNSPSTYEGYGSRVGTKKDAVLDWSDYFFLHFLPPSMKKKEKWPLLPSCEGVVERYGEELAKLGGRILSVLSICLGMNEGDLGLNFGGGEGAGACMRVSYYPKCPQPQLTLGLSSHSDPGGITILLAEPDVPGLEVRKKDEWFSVNPLPSSFIVNLGDQLQILTNGRYKSIEHRVITNEEKDRLSIAFFYNPKSDLLIKPMEKFVTDDKPAMYKAMTFDEYRVFIRTNGPMGKAQVHSIKLEK